MGRLENLGGVGRSHTGNAIEDICDRLALGEPVEEPAEALSDTLDCLHLIMLLKVAEILLPDARLLAYAFDLVLIKRFPNLLECAEGSQIWRHIEEGAPILATLGRALANNFPNDLPTALRLDRSGLRQANLRVRDVAVLVGIHIPLAFPVAHQDDAAGPAKTFVLRHFVSQCSHGHSRAPQLTTIP